MSSHSIIGLTGGICSGKSSISQYLTKIPAFNWILIDADKVGHDAYKRDTKCYEKLKDHFGSNIIGDDNEINRRELGRIVFNSKEEMRELEKIVWPEIREMIKNQLEDIVKDLSNRTLDIPTIVVVEAAIMIEAGWNDLVETIWVIVVDREEAIKRLVARNKLTEDEAIRRIDAQMSNEDRCAYANFILNTTTQSMEDMEIEINRILNLSITSKTK